MEKRIPVFLCLVLCFFQLQAQKNFKPGTITKEGKIINGFINYREWMKNPSSIEFSSSRDGGQPQIFGPNDIAGFEVTDFESYESHSCRISTGNVEVNRASLGKDTGSRTETVFLKVVEKGRITLYRYTDPLKDRFYIQTTGNDTVTELGYYVYIDPDNGSRFVTEREYISQLVNAGLPATEDFRLQQKINAAPYSEKSLQKLVREINQEEGVVREKPRGQVVHPILGAGAAISSYSFTGSRGSNILPTNEYDFSGSTSVLVFGGVKIYPNPATGKFFAIVDACWFKNSHTGSAQSSDDLYDYTWRYELDYSIIGIYFGAGYNFVKKPGFAFYLSAGPSWQLISVTKNKEHESRKWKTNPAMTDEYDLNPPGTENTAAAIELRAGVSINNRIDISAGLNALSGRVIGTTNFKDQSTIFELRIGYDFGKRH